MANRKSRGIFLATLTKKSTRLSCPNSNPPHPEVEPLPASSLSTAAQPSLPPHLPAPLQATAPLAANNALEGQQPTSARDDWPQCETCDSWSHLHCAGLTARSPKKATFKCHICNPSMQKSSSSPPSLLPPCLLRLQLPHLHPSTQH